MPQMAPLFADIFLLFYFPFLSMFVFIYFNFTLHASKLSSKPLLISPFKNYWNFN